MKTALKVALAYELLHEHKAMQIHRNLSVMPGAGALLNCAVASGCTYSGKSYRTRLRTIIEERDQNGCGGQKCIDAVTLTFVLF